MTGGQKTTKLAVVKDDCCILFVGERQACYDYMLDNDDWEDLRYINAIYPNPRNPNQEMYELGRLSSYILEPNNHNES